MGQETLSFLNESELETEWNKWQLEYSNHYIHAIKS